MERMSNYRGIICIFFTACVFFRLHVYYIGNLSITFISIILYNLIFIFLFIKKTIHEFSSEARQGRLILRLNGYLQTTMVLTKLPFKEFVTMVIKIKLKTLFF